MAGANGEHGQGFPGAAPVPGHRAKAREFATMRLRVDGGVVSAEG